MSGRCFQVGNPGISPREFTAHARMGQRDVLVRRTLKSGSDCLQTFLYSVMGENTTG